MTTIVVHDAKGKAMQFVDTGNFIIPAGFPGQSPESVKQTFENIAQFKCRDDDVMLLTYPKCGTNWIYEIVMMMFNQSATSVESMKVDTMLEVQTHEAVDTVPSPRALNTHVPYRFLPLEDMKEKKIKTILCVRNPKDCLVSYYNHVRGFESVYGYDGEWGDWLQMYMQGKMEYGLYSDYLKGFEKAMEEDTFPIHIVHYENLKLHGYEELCKIAEFLGLDMSDDMKHAIEEQCSFDKMAKEKAIPEFVSEIFSNGFTFFRKGQIGDWKNWFTVAQSEEFDRFWEKEMAGSKIKFTYTS